MYIHCLIHLFVCDWVNFCAQGDQRVLAALKLELQVVSYLMWILEAKLGLLEE